MHDFTHRKGYMEYLEQKRQAAKELRDAIPKPPTLYDRVRGWFAGLSEEDQGRAWTMKELKIVFGESPQAIASVLWGLGFSRKRMYKDSQPTARYWFK
jgi:hypothetical protein